MLTQTKFTVGDLTLRDSWWILKHSAKCLFFIAIFYGVWFLLIYVWDFGTKKTIGWEPFGAIWQEIVSIWTEIPTWGKIIIFSLVAILILYELTAVILIHFGESIKNFGRWLDKASFKKRFLATIGVALWFILLINFPVLLFALSFMLWTVVDVFEDLILEKQRTREEEEREIQSRKEDEEWQKEREEVDDEVNRILYEEDYNEEEK
jgi:signal transduction histidine kinase